MRDWSILLVVVGCIGAGIAFYIYQQTGDHIAYGDSFWGLEKTDYSYFVESATYVASKMQLRAIDAEPYRNYSLIGMIVGGCIIMIGLLLALVNRTEA